MLIYQENTKNFVNDVRENRLTDIMAQSFEVRFGYKVGPSEYNSWQNSLPRVRDIIELSGLSDNYIALEYEVPYNQTRIDCLLFGKDALNNDNVVLIELKQWSDVKALEDEGNFVETYTGGSQKVVPHPSQQVKGYSNYMKGFISAFEEDKPLLLFSCSYCHNYQNNKNTGLFDPIYDKLIVDYPVYSKTDVRPLASKIKELLSEGSGFEIFNRFMQSPVKPSKKLLENVAKVIKNEISFSLLNEQLVAKNLIWSKVRKAKKNNEKSIIIVHGGPGTGKSVIAVNLLAEAAAKGNINVHYGCKSKPFIEGMKSLVKADGKILFSNLLQFLPSRKEENQLDLLLIDEAHRIEKNSNSQYTKPEDRTSMPQVEQLIRCSKTTVFFIDDKQNVRSQEIGSSDLIREAAKKYNCSISEVELVTQYRCMGSNDYLLWLESTLGYNSDKRILRKDEIFDFRIVDSPDYLHKFLKSKEIEKPNSARLVAGFCWPWSDADVHGNLINDVVIGEFAMPWESKETNRGLAKGIPKWFEWAYKTGGVDQIGCIYTAQGFEFDYIGVIVGDDIYYDRETNSLQTNIKATADPTLKRYAANFDEHVRNIYRTLMSRGMKGCYVYFVNKDTEAYFKSFLE